MACSIAYAVVPAIFTTLAMGLVVYGVGRAWLFEVDVQNTPDDSPFFQTLGNATIVGVPLPIVAFAVLALVALGGAALDAVRPLYLCDGRQSGGGAHRRRAGSAADRLAICDHRRSSPMAPAS